MINTEIIEINDGGRIGIYYLKRIWNYYQQLKLIKAKPEKVEWKYINGVLTHWVSELNLP